jgi:1-acyl-sn-glycerol-3-phosphate acyltransferase
MVVGNGKKKKEDGPEGTFLSYCSLTNEEMKRLATGNEAERALSTVPVSSVSKEDILSVPEMAWYEELACILFLGFGIPNGIFTIPPTLYLIGWLVGSVKVTFVVAGALLLSLAILPQPFVPSILQSWMACQVARYFSFKFIFEGLPPPKTDSKDYHPRINVAPPHGVFPYGNILSILVYPSVCGHAFRGLAASSALRTPIFKQVMRSIGIIDASRHVARKALERKESLGISTGGVAEVFETNADDECIVLKERIGLIKLAIRTGADLVPCYMFGNTKLLSCWAGEGIPGGRNFLEKLSRKVGFAIIFIHGRFGLPIPRRIPVLGVSGQAIPTHHLQCEEPTKEQIDSIQKLLLNEMEEMFDRYKPLYGWDDKHLIIK